VTLAPTIDARSRRSFGDGAAGLLTALSLAVLFLVSGLMLNAMGITYDAGGGALWQKIHPASYVAFLALACLAFARLSPGAFLDDVARYHKGSLVFLGMTLLLLVHVAFFVHAPIAAIVDTFLLPVALLLLLSRISEREASMLAVFVHAAMTANALIAIFEFSTGARLTPLVAEGVTLVADWRSSALLGHPLHNALVTAAYTLIMIQGGGRDLRPVLRIGIVGLQLIALVAFGGRVATLMLIVFGGGAAAAHLWRAVRWRRLNAARVALFTAIATAATIGLIVLFTGGFFDLFAGRFEQDQGSADARVAMFGLLDQLPFAAFLFGSDPEHVATLQRLDGIEFGIESFWVAFVAFYGIVIAIPFFAALAGFFFDLKRATRIPSGWTILFFIGVCSTSLSLAGKTTAFAMFVAMLLLLLRPEPLAQENEG
jgi:hypothetical protein